MYHFIMETSDRYEPISKIMTSCPMIMQQNSSTAQWKDSVLSIFTVPGKGVLVSALFYKQRKQGQRNTSTLLPTNCIQLWKNTKQNNPGALCPRQAETPSGLPSCKNSSHLLYALADIPPHQNTMRDFI